MSLEQTEPEQVEDSVAEETEPALAPVEAEQVAEEPAAVEAEEPEVATEEPVAEDMPAQVAEEAAPEEPVEVAEAPAEEPVVGEGVVAETVAEPESQPEPAVIVATELPKLPFVTYDVVWLAFSGMLAWLLSAAPKDASTYSLPVYPVALGLGLVLAMAGPVLAFFVWMQARKAPWHRSGMFAQAMLWGALATLVGIVIWWAGLSIGDFLRLR